jgi:hypothetical protein
MPVTSPTDLVSRYLSAWHLPDHEDRVAAVAALWTAGGTHITDTRQWQGHQEIADRIRGSYERWIAPGGHQFTPAELMLTHHDRLIFTWNMITTHDHAVVSTGLDVIALSPSGHIESDHQFIVS